VVRAVVALPNISLDAAQLKNPIYLNTLKDYVWRVVEAESKGEIHA
jgi:hypothetical protein